MYNHLKLAETFAKLLDSQFQVGKFKFGLEPIIGLLPFSGDLVSLGLSFYILWIANELGLPLHVKTRMLTNILADFFIGIIPVIGDIADFTFKANTKNLELLKRYAPANIYEGQVI